MLRACVVTIKTTSTDDMRDRGRYHLSPAASFATLAALAAGLIAAVVLPA
jgi:hypothetical protein